MFRLAPSHELRSESLTGFWAAADVAVNASIVNANSIFFIVWSFVEFRL